MQTSAKIKSLASVAFLWHFLRSARPLYWHYFAGFATVSDARHPRRKLVALSPRGSNLSSHSAHSTRRSHRAQVKQRKSLSPLPFQLENETQNTFLRSCQYRLDSCEVLHVFISIRSRTDTSNRPSHSIRQTCLRHCYTYIFRPCAMLTPRFNPITSLQGPDTG